MKVIRKYPWISLAFLVAAALLRFWIVPILERLPANHANEAQLSEENQFRDSATAEWQESTLDVLRRDQTISTSGATSIIEGSMHIYFASGEVNFETTSLYGVDQRTRMNVPGYGSVERTGQYLFPPHVKRTKYAIWDPMFIGLREATFDHLDQMDGLDVYVFSFAASGMDESEGYSSLSDVPERYLAHTDGQGAVWVEPLSGTVVDYSDSGVSYFVDPSTGARLADFNQWSESYKPETQAAQLALARAARRRFLLLEVWIPGLVVLTGLIWLAVGLIKGRKETDVAIAS